MMALKNCSFSKFNKPRLIFQNVKIDKLCLNQQINDVVDSFTV